MIAFAAASAPRVSVVVVASQRSPHLVDCLESVKHTTHDIACEVIVVMNEPADQLRTELARAATGILLFEFRANLGFGASANYAVAQSRGEYVLLLSDEVVLMPGWLEELVGTAVRRRGCAAVGGTSYHSDGSLREAGAVVWWDGLTSAIGDGEMISEFTSFERRVDFCSGEFLLIRRSAWDEVGGFDEQYYPGCFADIDLCLRLQQRAHQVWYQPLAAAVHKGEVATTTGRDSAAFEGNRRRFIEQWAPSLVERADVRSVEDAIWAAMGRPLRVLVIDDRIPSYRLGSGFGRMHDVLSTLSEDASLSVTFHPYYSDGVVPADLSRMGIRVVWDLDHHLAAQGARYDVAVISRPHNARYFVGVIERLLPDTPIIFDAEALYFRRLASQADLATTPSERERLLAECRSMRDVETAVLRRVDHVVCISDDEASVVRGLTDVPVSVVSPLLRAPRPTSASFAERAHVGFVAGWLAGPGGPNSDALLWYAKEVMPRVTARLPWCRLLVTGASPPDDVRWLDGTSVSFVGEVQELAEFYDSVRVIISPTRFGAGVKLKTVEAIQHGVPVVATTEGAAGLDGGMRRSIAVRDDAAAFADAVIALVADRSAWDRARRVLLEDKASPSASPGAGAWPDLVRSTVRTSVR